MKIISATNPRYSAEGGASIDLDLLLDGRGEPIAFTARPDDVEAHGRELYQRALAGEYGAVAPFGSITL